MRRPARGSPGYPPGKGFPGGGARLSPVFGGTPAGLSPVFGSTPARVSPVCPIPRQGLPRTPAGRSPVGRETPAKPSTPRNGLPDRCGKVFHRPRQNFPADPGKSFPRISWFLTKLFQPSSVDSSAQGAGARRDGFFELFFQPACLRPGLEGPSSASDRLPFCGVSPVGKEGDETGALPRVPPDRPLLCREESMASLPGPEDTANIPRHPAEDRTALRREGATFQTRRALTTFPAIRPGRPDRSLPGRAQGHSFTVRRARPPLSGCGRPSPSPGCGPNNQKSLPA